MKLFVRLLFILPIVVFISSCRKDDPVPSTLSEYINQNPGFSISPQLIACACGGQKGFLDDEIYPISVFFYPIAGAYEFRYFESNRVDIDIKDYPQFRERKFPDEPLFNGYLWRFKHTTISDDVWGIVTYKVGKVLHICRAIRLKLNSKPSQNAPELVTITPNGTQPIFDWQDGRIKENVIYFEIVSDTLNNLISGTYTYDKHFKFYDTSNVVLNITNPSSNPTLQNNRNYFFTLMGVSYDNWVNLIGQKPFNTH